MKLETNKINEVGPYCYTYKIAERIRLYVEYSPYSRDDIPEKIHVQKKHIHAWWYNRFEFNVNIKTW